MDQIHQIAQAEWRERIAKLEAARHVEGVTVQVPNVFDRAVVRAVMVVRRVIAGRTARAGRRAPESVHQPA